VLSVGLTGGIATGKSAVSKLLQTRPNVLVVDADAVSREICSVGSKGLKAVIERFGSDFLKDDGTLDRRRLRNLVLNDSAARSDLESILHPRIATAISQKAERALSDGIELFVVEAALMIETGSYRNYDALIVVTCEVDTQLTRLVNRDGLAIENAKKWISTQLPLADKAALADHVISNNDDFQALEFAVERLLEKLLPG
jgi:dephospho-CoA kinase